ncbi:MULTISPECIES: hypothetical protein [unclassified Actinobaculum]|uniref:hypothetical protein n=1 Tax=unclassified Actinobaculum TaxID=2609299 RepID=UPI000D5284EF|nr:MULTISPECIES: hypothetical protein [unclassified Actinobaculum]AWE43091.1 hypothetical protein DDD63_10465 [Actinobaculum sp. 313]RTE48523.1 hypothetical protein EKN07_09150 [Actinobaculum sp. 352]
MRPQVSFNGRVVRIAVIVIALFILGWLALTKPSFRDSNIGRVHCAPIIYPTFGAVPGNVVQPDEQTLTAFDEYADDMSYGDDIQKMLKASWPTACHVARMDRRIDILFTGAASLVVALSIPFTRCVTITLPRRKPRPTRTTPEWRHHV